MGLFRHKESKAECHVVYDSWESYFCTYGEGQLASIGFDLAAGTERHHEGYKHCRRVIVFVDAKRVQEDGMPSQEDVKQLIALEQSLTSMLQQENVDCRFVGRMTYGGMRELVFQVEDVRDFGRVVSGWIETVSGYEIEVRKKRGWSFFDEKVRPSPANWQQISDRQVIDELVEAGSDPARAHVLEHVFNGKMKKLQQIAQELSAEGFTQVDLTDGTLIVSKPSRLDLHEISKLTAALVSFAGSMGVVYDGWGSKYSGG